MFSSSHTSSTVSFPQVAPLMSLRHPTIATCNEADSRPCGRCHGGAKKGKGYRGSAHAVGVPSERERGATEQNQQPWFPTISAEHRCLSASRLCVSGQQ